MTALDIIKRLKEIKKRILPLKCAPISKIPSSISTMNKLGKVAVPDPARFGYFGRIQISFLYSDLDPDLLKDTDT